GRRDPPASCGACAPRSRAGAPRRDDRSADAGRATTVGTMREVLDAIEAAAAAGEQAAVATVVATIRSAPRQPGAKLVVTEGGQLVGSVSGGCVESDVAERAQQLFRGGGPELVHYGVADEDAWDVGLACGGEIDVFLGRADP